MYECDICNRRFALKQSYSRHIKNPNIHIKYQDAVKSYKCNCGNVYLHHSNLSKHKRKCGVIQNNEIVQSQSQSQSQFELEQTEDVDRKTLLEILLKERRQFDIERQQFEKEKEELQTQVEREKQNKTIGTQNNNLNIQINAFGCENLEYITDKFKIKCLKQIYKSIPEIVAKIHFNTKYPENHNVKIPNKKLPHASIMTQENTWKTVDKKDAITSMVDKSFNLLENTYEEHKGELSEMKRKNYEKYQERYLDQDKDLHKKLENDVECLVLDGTR